MKHVDLYILSEIGGRDEMEDSDGVRLISVGDRECFFCGVFDGHGGCSIAKNLSVQLVNYVIDGIASGEGFRKALKLAYIKASKVEWTQKRTEGSCVATFILNEETITSANVGDCRVVILGKNVRQVTRDHNANQPSEVKRVQACGALITGTRTKYICYQRECLAPTRAIGDLHFKDVGVIATPFISQRKIKPTDRFIVAATDGLFNYVSNEEVLEISRGVKTAEELAKALNVAALENLSDDNVTISVVKLN
jgi:serine/threonine protein phosphatase PrpC